MEKFLVQQKWEKNRRPSISVLLARRHSKIGPKFVFCLFFFFTLVFFSTSGRRKGRLRAATSKKKYLASKTTNRISSISVRRRRRWKIRSIRRHFLFQSLLNGTQCRSPSARFTFPRLDFAQIWLNLIVEFDCSRPFFFWSLLASGNVDQLLLLGFTGFYWIFTGFYWISGDGWGDIRRPDINQWNVQGNRWQFSLVFFSAPSPLPTFVHEIFSSNHQSVFFICFFLERGKSDSNFVLFECVCVCVCVHHLWRVKKNNENAPKRDESTA